MDRYDTLLQLVGERNKQIRALEVERDRLLADIKAERDINLASGCPDCGVHDGCYRVVVERDRLRDGIMSAEVHGELIVRMRESVWLKHEAERDRLRAVVDAVRHFILLQVTDDHPAEDDYAAWDRMIASLEQLDVSPDMGGEL